MRSWPGSSSPSLSLDYFNRTSGDPSLLPHPALFPCVIPASLFSLSPNCVSLSVLVSHCLSSVYLSNWEVNWLFFCLLSFSCTRVIFSSLVSPSLSDPTVPSCPPGPLLVIPIAGLWIPDPLVRLETRLEAHSLALSSLTLFSKFLNPP